MGTQDTIITEVKDRNTRYVATEVKDGNTRYYHYRSKRWELKILLQK